MRRFYEPHRYNPYHDGYPGEFVYGDDVNIDDYYMEELWKPIKGFNGEYWVSDMGRVWSIKRRKFLRIKPLDDHGHLGVCLYKNGDRYYRYIHVLVAEAFIPNPHNHPFVRHIDDIPSNNTTDDLLCGTRRDNYLDSVRNGTAYILSDADREKGNADRKTPIIATNLFTKEKIYFKSQGEASRCLRIPQANIWKVLVGQRLRAGDYTFVYDERRECDANY